ncbi:Rrf2 family transcriptional regulator [Porticoccus sp. W117]|uniref:Rrf2 family transcriptional regulator n=1 Tax=Porticoccus sp. W117 TaxID=3054777 RepID=UPI0025932D61|nr:Rrf2 family transcriptional regulator [Porticoccus sp. W117]MDM3871162.1 Rrf2 family transcriptional regulator [Porticoccus sp. W117]
MHLTRFTDYGLRVLMYAALQPQGEKARIAEVSQVFGISRNHVMKIVNRLANEGWLATSRGKGGGFQLGQHTEKIGVGAVVRTLEESLEIVDCEGDSCPIITCCRLKSALNSAREAFLGELDNYTLADLVSSPRRLKQVLQLSG